MRSAKSRYLLRLNILLPLHYVGFSALVLTTDANAYVLTFKQLPYKKFDTARLVQVVLQILLIKDIIELESEM